MYDFEATHETIATLEQMGVMQMNNRYLEAAVETFSVVPHRLRRPTGNETVSGDDPANLLTRYARFSGR